MNRTGISFLFLIAVSAACGADSVVVDPSGRPIPHAQVTCAGTTTETAADGRFSLPSSAPCQLVISAPDFETLRIDISSAVPPRIELSIAPNAEVVIVSAVRRETTAEEAGVSASVVTSVDLTARDYPALGDILPEITGVQVSRYGRPGSLTQVFGRGGDRRGMLLMIDGVPVNDPGGELNLAGFTTTGFDRMEVVRGPESALFGAEASSGVVQLFTSHGTPENVLPRGSVSYERGSFQTDRWTANLGGGSGSRFDYFLAADQFHTVGEYVNDYFRDTTGTADLGFRISPATQLRGIFRTFDATTGTPNQVGYGIYALDANEATRDTLVSATLDDVRGRNFVQHVRFGYHRSWDQSVGSSVFATPGAGMGAYDVSALVRDVNSPAPRVYFEGLTNPALPVPPGLRLVTVSVSSFPSDPYLTLSSRKNIEYQGALAHPGGTAVFGYEYERQDAEVTGLPVSRDNHGFFLHEQYSFARRAFLSGGVRLEQNSAFHTKLTPRGAVGYLLAGEHGVLSSTYLRASAGIGFTEPSLIENYSQNPYYVGNRALRPEKTTSYEAGVVEEWSHRRVRTELSAFDNSFRDLIVFVSPPYPQLATWQNIDRSRARGLEFSTRAKLTGRLTAEGSYTRLWSRIINTSSPDSLYTGIGQELPHRAGNSGAVSMRFAPRRWMFQAGAVFVGERQDPDAYVFGVSRNRGYQNVYAAGSFRLTKNVVPYFHAGNLFNEHYMEILGYPAATRNLNGGLRFQW